MEKDLLKKKNKQEIQTPWSFHTEWEKGTIQNNKILYYKALDRELDWDSTIFPLILPLLNPCT